MTDLKRAEILIGFKRLLHFIRLRNKIRIFSENIKKKISIPSYFPFGTEGIPYSR